MLAIEHIRACTFISNSGRCVDRISFFQSNDGTHSLTIRFFSPSENLRAIWSFARRLLCNASMCDVEVALPKLNRELHKQIICYCVNLGVLDRAVQKAIEIRLDTWLSEPKVLQQHQDFFTFFKNPCLDVAETACMEEGKMTDVIGSSSRFLPVSQRGEFISCSDNASPLP